MPLCSCYSRKVLVLPWRMLELLRDDEHLRVCVCVFFNSQDRQKLPSSVDLMRTVLLLGGLPIIHVTQVIRGRLPGRD